MLDEKEGATNARGAEDVLLSFLQNSAHEL